MKSLVQKNAVFLLPFSSNPKCKTTDSHNNFKLAQPLVNCIITRGKSLNAGQKINWKHSKLHKDKVEDSICNQGGRANSLMTEKICAEG